MSWSDRKCLLHAQLPAFPNPCAKKYDLITKTCTCKSVKCERTYLCPMKSHPLPKGLVFLTDYYLAPVQYAPPIAVNSSLHTSVSPVLNWNVTYLGIGVSNGSLDSLHFTLHEPCYIFSITRQKSGEIVLGICQLNARMHSEMYNNITSSAFENSLVIRNTHTHLWCREILPRSLPWDWLRDMFHRSQLLPCMKIRSAPATMNIFIQVEVEHESV